MNGVGTGLKVENLPFDLYWNTNVIENGDYSIKLKLMDENNLEVFSEAITLKVDNSLAIPPLSEIDQIDLINGNLHINWKKSTASDFFSYKLEKSSDSLMNENQVIKETASIADTFYIDEGIDNLVNQYFRIVTTDTFGYHSKSTIICFEKNSSPNFIEFYSIGYDTTELKIIWSKSRDIDFKKYTLYVSDAQTSLRNQIGVYNNILDTTFATDDFNPNYLKWYWIEVEDSLGQKSLSSPISYPINSPPNRVNISSVNYNLDTMTIRWGDFLEEDFYSYEILQSSNQFTNFSTIKTIYNQNTITHSLSEFDPTQENWFKIKVNDFWNLNSTGDPISATVDSNPEPVDIQSIEYNLEEMTIHWALSNAEDFYSYEIFQSENNNEGYELVQTIFNQSISSYTLSDFNPTIENWFKIKVIDHWGLTCFGGEMSNTLDPVPNPSILDSILYQDGQLFFTWSMNLENDFESYSLYESLSSQFTEPSLVSTFSDLNDTTFQLDFSPGRINYYKVKVQDQWGQTSFSNEVQGNSYSTFNHSYGGAEVDYGKSVQQLINKDYLVCGTTSSEGNGSTDAFVLKTDSLGVEQWMVTFGGINSDYGHQIIESNSGGYIFVGSTESYGSGLSNILVLKMDENGNQDWVQTYGGTASEKGNSICQLSNNDYIIVGFTNSYGAGQKDVWLLKIDNQGNEIWSQTYGTNMNNYAVSIIPSLDSGFFVLSNDEKIEAENIYDISILKFNSNGNIEWEQVLGGQSNDRGYSLIDGGDGLILCGTTTSFGNGLTDGYIVKVDYSGNIIWEQTYGESLNEKAFSIVQAEDGGYVGVGTQESDLGLEGYNVWLFKITNNGVIQWSRTLGTDNTEEGFSIAKSSDGGFVLTGIWNEDIFLIKTDREGHLVN